MKRKLLAHPRRTHFKFVCCRFTGCSATSASCGITSSASGWSRTTSRRTRTSAAGIALQLLANVILHLSFVLQELQRSKWKSWKDWKRQRHGHWLVWAVGHKHGHGPVWTYGLGRLGKSSTLLLSDSHPVTSFRFLAFVKISVGFSRAQIMVGRIALEGTPISCLSHRKSLWFFVIWRKLPCLTMYFFVWQCNFRCLTMYLLLVITDDRAAFSDEQKI